jgi:uncharacterized OsmC-like protein
MSEKDYSVVVTGSADGFVQDVSAGPHRFRADEPVDAGGTDQGPSPYALLLASLGSCTSMTLGLYARRRKIPLERVTVSLRHQRVHAEDCVDCDQTVRMLDQIERHIELTGPINAEQRAALLAIADKCPVHRTLTGQIRIRTTS